VERFFEKLSSDRRLATRHYLQTPMRIRIRGTINAERRMESENLSQRGVLFSTDLELTKGATLDLLLDMPEAITGVPTAQWLCTGHVVRVEQREAPKAARGLAVQFDFYEISRGDRPGWPMRVGLRGPVAPIVERREVLSSAPTKY
jgi:hypothetical protein